MLYDGKWQGHGHAAAGQGSSMVVLYCNFPQMSFTQLLKDKEMDTCDMAGSAFKENVSCRANYVSFEASFWAILLKIAAILPRPLCCVQPKLTTYDNTC